ncbi:MAG: restriction endonuclease subunit R [Verrucomicrobiae bacterium]|nr:restriction endonuclease subunit R [Verrucomicrobiae bacterium]
MPLPFYQRLVLTKWALGLFGGSDLSDLSRHLKADSLEGFDEDNISKFVQVLTCHLPSDTSLTKELLLGYDANIVRHWRGIAEPRSKGGKIITPKYYQYLCLLFTEIYLDRYFQDKNALLEELNRFLRDFNAELPRTDKVEEFRLEDLNKLAFWNATGSGKTLLMHVNILQYRHYLSLRGKARDLNRIILLTPNEGLSRQHLEEFTQSKMQAVLFSKGQSISHKLGLIEIIDIHKIREESGDKTVAVDTFEGNNLVLVDEGHKGSGGVEWMDKRNRLCAQGFSFEYSATFGQALKAANNAGLTQLYAKCILFDYSYRYFYGDGYGKDYRILNLADDSDDGRRNLYLIACLLSFYQQMRLYEEGRQEFRPFNIHCPLLVFVGSKVTAVRTERGQKVSDVIAILQFISSFTMDKAGSIEGLRRILKHEDGLTDPKGRNIFAAAFGHLHYEGLHAEEVFDDILKRVFHAAAPGKLHVEFLKGGDGEIALKLGEGNQPFGVINVGDAKELWKLCDDISELVTIEKDFSESLFRKINADDGGINVLIGSKKFTEGWNSWRVSTMGLMNIGRSEGSEIIQLFGRGVRLKGFEFCLKRSSEVRAPKTPQFIKTCETLNIFGIRADYMQQFQEYLADEGLPTDVEEFILPVVNNLGRIKLKVPKVSDEANFKATQRPTLEFPPEPLTSRPLILDWYPKIQAIIAQGLRGGLADAKKNEVRRLTDRHLAFINWDDVYFELVRFKNERSWFNFNLSKEILPELVSKGGWFKLLIPEGDIEPVNFANIRRCQEVVIALLKKYCDRYYGFRKDEYEKPFIQYAELGPDDPNFFESYKVAVDRSAIEIIEEVKAIQTAIAEKKLTNMSFGKIQPIIFERHLYSPLLHIKDGSELVTISPVELNEGEKDFVLDLKVYYEKHKSWFEGRELYLLRNRSRGKGIGFFEAENFYPDFILWLLQDEKQHIAFIDPKGILRLRGLEDPKIMFHKTIKNLENRLNDHNVTMDAFIISSTSIEDVKWWSGGDILEFNKRNVLFQKEDKDIYIKMILERIFDATKL